MKKAIAGYMTRLKWGKIYQIIIEVPQNYIKNISRNLINLTAAGFVAIGTLCDVGTFYFSKDIEIFDEKQNSQELEELKRTAN